MEDASHNIKSDITDAFPNSDDLVLPASSPAPDSIVWLAGHVTRKNAARRVFLRSVRTRHRAEGGKGRRCPLSRRLHSFHGMGYRNFKLQVQINPKRNIRGQINQNSNIHVLINPKRNICVLINQHRNIMPINIRQNKLPTISDQPEKQCIYFF